MKRTCPVCKLGTLNPGTASALFERDGMTVVIKAAPALVCDTCGEVWFEDAAADRLADLAEVAFAASGDVEVISYAA